MTLKEFANRTPIHFDSRTMRSIVCESMLSDTVAMENHSALHAAWLCRRVWFLETRFRFEKNVMRPEAVTFALPVGANVLRRLRSDLLNPKFGSQNSAFL